jgi:N-carbamoylputrescine amidase
MIYRKPYRLGIIQFAMRPDPQANLARAVEKLHAAAGQGADVLCLPELFTGPYPCQQEDARWFDLAEPIPGASTQTLAEIAAQTSTWILAPLFERRAAGVYHNSLAVISPKGCVEDVYRKMHIPDDPGFYEKYYFTPGDGGFRTVRTPLGSIGTLICWDQWFPEAARLTALRGADVLVYPTAIGYLPQEKQELGPEQLSAWQIVQRSHAIANGLYVAAVNRVGFEPANPDRPDDAEGIEFWGHSFLADPMGQVVAEADDREQILVAEIDPARIEQTRRAWPFLRDRRIDAYGDLSRRMIDDA